MADVQFHKLQGRELDPWLMDLARLRITVFREFPYLYDGSVEYELDYLKSYQDADDGLVVMVTDADGKVVGATTCLPMEQSAPEFRQPFIDEGKDLSEIMYFGESVLLSEWRGKGIGKAFFKYREMHARSLGFKVMTFCAVDRTENHPLRPDDYQPLDGFWGHLGYERQDGLKCWYPWTDLGDVEESAKSLTFWLKHDV